MDLRSFFAGIAIVGWLAVGENIRAASIDVSAWELGDRISLAGIGLVGAGDGVPRTPFEQEFHTTLSNSATTSYYDVVWDNTGHLDFYVEVQHHCQGAPGSSAFCRSTGNIYFVPAFDSIITVAAEYNYSLGNGDREALSVVAVGGGPDAEMLLGWIERTTPIGGEPPIGTHSFQGTAELLAGESYIFGYQLELASFGGSPTNLSHADGSLRATIMPVPEPTAALLLLSLTPLVQCRRRHPHC